MADAAVAAAENEAAGGPNGVHVVDYDPELEHDQAEASLGPLFQLNAAKKAMHARTRVYRDEPIDEGHLGNIGPDDTEETIERKWGGTVFRVEAVDEHGRIIARRSNVKIAAEPKFTSSLGRKKYRAWLQGEFEEGQTVFDDTKPPVAPVTPIRSAEDQSHLEQDRHRRELERIKAEAEAYAQRAKSDLDLAVARARAESEAAIARVRAEAEEREKRDRAFYDAQQKQQNDFLVATKAQERTTDPIAMLKTMTGIYADMREAQGDSGHAPDVATAIVENLDKILGAVDTVAGGARSSAPTKRPAAAAPNGEDTVTLTDTLAKKAKLAARHLQAQGVKNPAAALSQQIERSLDRIMQARVVNGDKGKPAPKKIAAKPTGKGKK